MPTDGRYRRAAGVQRLSWSEFPEHRRAAIRAAGGRSKHPCHSGCCRCVSAGRAKLCRDRA